MDVSGSAASEGVQRNAGEGIGEGIGDIRCPLRTGAQEGVWVYRYRRRVESGGRDCVTVGRGSNGGAREPSRFKPWQASARSSIARTHSHSHITSHTGHSQRHARDAYNALTQTKIAQVQGHTGFGTAVRPRRYRPPQRSSAFRGRHLHSALRRHDAMIEYSRTAICGNVSIASAAGAGAARARVARFWRGCLPKPPVGWTWSRRRVVGGGGPYGREGVCDIFLTVLDRVFFYRL